MKKKIIKLLDFTSLQSAIRYLNSLNLGDGWEIEVRPAKDTRSYSQSDLYFMWCGLAAKHFSKKGNKFTKDDMHDLFRFKYLGYTDGRIVGKTQLQPELKSTTKLKVDEMYSYMMKIEAFCAEHGLLLPTPEDSDYDKKKRKNGGYD